MKNFFKDLGKSGKIALAAVGILVITGATVFATGEIIRSSNENNQVNQPPALVEEVTKQDDQTAEQSKPDAGKNNGGQEQVAPAQPSAEAPAQQNPAPQKPSKPSAISLDKAKSIALGQVKGATSGDIVKAHKDYDDGRLVYEITIVKGGYEYDFEISGSGKIIEKEIDRLDRDDYDDYDDDYYDDYDDDDDWD